MRVLKIGSLIIGLALFVLLPFFSYQSFASDISSGQVILTQQEFQTLKQNLKTLKTNSENSDNAMRNSQNQLTVASLSMTEQQKELVALKNLTQQQADELAIVRRKLSEQEISIMTANESLTKANQFLEEQKKEIEKSNSNNRKKNWIIGLAAGGLITYLAFK